jgi:4-amino-4-deoxy-L-arabinose transferase-like glycosyltransferase
MRPDFFSARRTWIGLALVVICAAHILGVLWLHPRDFFGWLRDDAIYFSSAKALAEGKGYILPSVPGMPAATKYPVLYSWLLSWVWRWNPSFPSNLSAALVLNLIFGCLFALMSFAFLRQLKGLNDITRVVLTSFCALHPLVLFHAGNVLTDVPFAAIALTAIVLAYKSIEAQGGAASAILSGVVCGFAILMRALGAPVAAGLCFVMLLRRRWRESMAYAASVAPFFVAMFWRSIVSVPQKPPSAASSCAAAWQNTWFYYTNYPAFWKVAAIDNHTFWQNVHANIIACLLQPGMYLFEAPAAKSYILGLIIAILLSAIALRGLVRQVQTNGWHPIFLVLGLYLMPLLIWDYPSPDRFLLPFLPLFVVGIARESIYLTELVRVYFHKRSNMESRITVIFFCATGAILLVAVGFSWWWGTNFLRQKSQQRADLLAEKREAYQWLRQNGVPSARFIAWEDATAFLYTSRQGMCPTAFLPAGIYRLDILDADLSCLTSSALPIGATYWLMADDDFGLDWGSAIRGARAKEAEAEKTLRLLFRSRGGRVRIYALPSYDRPAT